MGMRIPGMSGIDPKMVDNLVAAEKIPVEQAKKRREKIVEEKAEVEKLGKMLSELESSVMGLKSKGDFYKLKVESSHPDILEGAIEGIAQLGSYEFEVRGMARNEKELAFGFPDKDQTSVGFGYMEIEREGMENAEIVVEPGATLQDVAQQINDAELGVRAMVVNTKYNPDSFRLLVVSDKSGRESKIHIDEDTTFLEFKEQVTGRGLDVLFEDVPVTDDDNTLDELVDGVQFTIKRSEPGTRIQVNVTYDMDKTVEGIAAFVEKYNEVVRFSAEQSKDPNAGEPGKLSGDYSVKQVMRTLQNALFPATGQSTKFQTLAEIGINTNPKTGELQMDDAKVRSALSDNYDAVAQLFIRSKTGDGIGERVAEKLKSFRDPASGLVRGRVKGLESVIANQDKDIARRERNVEEREQAIRRRFMSLESQMTGLKQQGDFLSQRFGGGGGQSQGGG